MHESGWIVETGWLRDNLGNPDVRILDATWFMPGSDIDPFEEFKKAHIPGAVFFDIDAVADTGSGLPHMLPSTGFFAEAVGKMGIRNTDQIVIYDQTGIFSSPRVWWTFRTMGHKNVAILNGGFKKWLADGYQTISGEGDTYPPSVYTAELQNYLVRDFNQVLETVLSSASEPVILDARPSPRFLGDAPEPRAGLKSGHMPDSINIPSSLLVADNGTIRSQDELRKIFLSRGVNPAGSIITTCGSGITAAIIALALALIGNNSVAVYDGSWAEWASREDAIIESHTRD